MIKYVKNTSYIDLCNMLIGKKARFKSDCEFFPNFDITGIVKSIDIANYNEIIFKISKNGKTYDIGSHMKNLSYEIIS